MALYEVYLENGDLPIMQQKLDSEGRPVFRLEAVDGGQDGEVSVPVPVLEPETVDGRSGSEPTGRVHYRRFVCSVSGEKQARALAYERECQEPYLDEDGSVRVRPSGYEIKSVSKVG